jgi:hypothetical protein
VLSTVERRSILTSLRASIKEIILTKNGMERCGNPWVEILSAFIIQKAVQRHSTTQL